MWMYVGPYTSKGSRGIYGVTLDETAGTFDTPKLLVETGNPSFLVIDSLGNHLYAACDPGVFDGKRAGGVAAFAIDPATRGLTLVNAQHSGKGGNCFVGLTPDHRAVLTADYGPAIVDLLPINPDGSLQPSAATATHEGRGPDPDRQSSAHAHSFYADPTGKFGLSCDLGTDEVIVYTIDTPPGLTRHSSIAIHPGSGPRHLQFSKNGKLVYLVNELDNTVDVLTWDATAGTLKHLQRVPMLPPDFHSFSKAAEIAVHPTGAFVYASNRGHDSIAVFHVDRDSGLLSVAGQTPCGGKGPRHFAVDPTGRFLVVANEESDNLVAFRIDLDTGALTPTGGTATVSRPVCVIFPPK